MNYFSQPRRTVVHAGKVCQPDIHLLCARLAFVSCDLTLKKCSLESLGRSKACIPTSCFALMNPYSPNSSLDGEMVMTDAPTVLVLGETGAGKSYFINTLAPGMAEVGNRLESCELVEAVDLSNTLLW